MLPEEDGCAKPKGREGLATRPGGVTMAKTNLALKAYTDFANEHRDCFFATLEGEQPRVRIFRMWYADDSGFYFVTRDSKSVFRQVQSRPRIEVLFFKTDEKIIDMKVMRVSGQVELLDDPVVIERMLQERPSARKPEAIGKPRILRMKSGEAWFWTREKNEKEGQIERIHF